MDKLTLKLLTNKLPEITEDTLVYCFAHDNRLFKNIQYYILSYYQ